MAANRLRWVFFDAGFTLLKPDPGIGHHYADVARDYGVEASPAAIDAAFHQVWKSARIAQQGTGRLCYGRDRAEALVFWSGVVRHCLEHAGATPPEDPEYYRTVFDRFEEARCWRVYDDVESALALVEALGLRAGVLSNWDVRLHRVVEALGLKPRLEPVVISSDVGVEKPDGAIFEAAERLTGCRPEELALIGDEPKADGEGARARGWRQCLVWRDTRPAPTHLRWAPTLDAAVRAVIEGP